MRTSGTSSRFPCLPTAGCEVFFPWNVPVPLVRKEQPSYAPIFPAPASSMARATASTWVGGTNVTILFICRAGVCKKSRTTRPRADARAKLVPPRAASRFVCAEKSAILFRTRAMAHRDTWFRGVMACNGWKRRGWWLTIMFARRRPASSIALPVTSSATRIPLTRERGSPTCNPTLSRSIAVSGGAHSSIICCTSLTVTLSYP